MKLHTTHPPRLSLMALLCRCVLLVVLAGAVALAVNAARPDSLPLTLRAVPCAGIPVAWWRRLQPLPVAAVHTLWQQRAASFLDAREDQDVENYPMNHLPGAYEVYYSKFSTLFAHLQPPLPRGRPVVIYGTGRPCDKALRVAKYLLEDGYRVYLLAGGFPAWKQAGYPLQSGHERGAPGVTP